MLYTGKRIGLGIGAPLLIDLYTIIKFIYLFFCDHASNTQGLLRNHYWFGRLYEILGLKPSSAVFKFIILPTIQLPV